MLVPFAMENFKMASLVHINRCVFVFLGGWVFVLDVTRGLVGVHWKGHHSIPTIGVLIVHNIPSH